MKIKSVIAYNQKGAWEKHTGEVLESRVLPGFKIEGREFWE